MGFYRNTCAQEEYPRFRKNAISLNIPSFTRIYSLNYERVLSQKKLAIVSHIGFYYLPIDASTKNLTALFTGIDFLIGKKKHYLDLGGSLMFDKNFNYITPNEKSHLLGLSLFPKLGYRYQKKADGIFFRALLIPFLIDIIPRQSLDQLNKKYFNIESTSTQVVSFGIGYSF